MRTGILICLIGTCGAASVVTQATTGVVQDVALFATFITAAFAVAVIALEFRR